MIKTILEHATNITGVYNSEFRYIQPSLAVTPSQMLDMSQHGIAISSQMNDKMFYDGDDSYIVNVDPLDYRGVDVNDAWNASQEAKKKISRLYKTQSVVKE